MNVHKILLPLTLLLIFCLFLLGCKKENKIIKINGEAQGTYYSISYIDSNNRNLSLQFDSIFKEIDKSVSTYLETSIISRFNSNDTSAIADDLFTIVFNKSQEVSVKTNGAFDITVLPLVKAWGFDLDNALDMNERKVDSLLQFIGYNKVKLLNGKLVKENPNVKISFNAIAQGYSSDIIGNYLKLLGITNFIVDVGGEVLANGDKGKNIDWLVAIEQPAQNSSDERTINAVMPLKNKALATSGNYRKFFIKDGLKYSHTIDTKTGKPVNHSLLSVSVLANDCISADAYATAFMVMGLEKAIQFLQSNPDLKAYFIFNDSKGNIKTWHSNDMNIIKDR